MKYIIESNDVIGYTPKYAMLFGDGYMIQPLEDLEVLDADYVNEHFGILQDDAYNAGFENGKKEAYQKGFEDGKWKSEDGCTGCKYEGKTGEHLPCDYCMNNFKNQWTASDDEIKVGDEFRSKRGWTAVVVKIDGYGLLLMDSSGAVGSYSDISIFTKTGRHFDIASILEAMKHD